MLQESKHDELIRKLYVFTILFVLGSHYFEEGYLLPFTTNYVEICLNLTHSEDIGSKLVFFYYLGNVSARVIAVFIFDFLKFTTVVSTNIFIASIVSGMFVLTQYAWISKNVITLSYLNDDHDNQDEANMITSLYALFTVIGTCRALGYASTWGLVAPVYSVKSWMATGDMVVYAAAFAIGGYGMGTIFDNFGYFLYPWFCFVSIMIKIIIYLIIIPYHNKVTRL